MDVVLGNARTPQAMPLAAVPARTAVRPGAVSDQTRPSPPGQERARAPSQPMTATTWVALALAIGLGFAWCLLLVSGLTHLLNLRRFRAVVHAQGLLPIGWVRAASGGFAATEALTGMIGLLGQLPVATGHQAVRGALGNPGGGLLRGDDGVRGEVGVGRLRGAVRLPGEQQASRALHPRSAGPADSADGMLPISGGRGPRLLSTGVWDRSGGVGRSDDPRRFKSPSRGDGEVIVQCTGGRWSTLFNRV